MSLPPLLPLFFVLNSCFCVCMLLFFMFLCVTFYLVSLCKLLYIRYLCLFQEKFQAKPRLPCQNCVKTMHSACVVSYICGLPRVCFSFCVISFGFLFVVTMCVRTVDSVTAQAWHHWTWPRAFHDGFGRKGGIHEMSLHFSRYLAHPVLSMFFSALQDVRFWAPPFVLRITYWVSLCVCVATTDRIRNIFKQEEA